jgi:hypothetical protein
MPVTSITPTGPAGTCDICGKTFGHYEGNIECGICEAVHCDQCASEAAKRGHYSPDADFVDGAFVDNSHWDGCVNCMGKQECPNCGKWATFSEHEADSVETHGLDCGPYEHWHEEWLTCDVCGAKTDVDELAQMNADEQQSWPACGAA